jgi:hypothetical protein
MKSRNDVIFASSRSFNINLKLIWEKNVAIPDDF